MKKNNHISRVLFLCFLMLPFFTLGQPSRNNSRSKTYDAKFYSHDPNYRLIDGKKFSNILPLVGHKVISEQIANNTFESDLGFILMQNCSVKSIFIGSNHFKHLEVICKEDTLADLWSFEVNNVDYYFSFCSLSNKLRLDKHKAGSNFNINFEKCSFDNNTSFLGVAPDTLSFFECTETKKGMFIGFSNFNRPTVLKFSETDLTHIGFNYDDNYVLYQFKNPDSTRIVYEQLLVKFQNEKKLASYERVDKEYFQFRHSRVVNWLAYLWWDYGYNKWLIIAWTIGFVLLFTAINYKNWLHILQTYPMKSDKTITMEASKLQKALKILVYTSFIFFSIKIDFDKLSFTNTKWLVYFFIQYITGLICLFFIANAILKL